MIFGPDVASLFLSTVLIAVPGIAFCVKIFDKIRQGEGKDHAKFKPEDAWYCIMAVGAFLTILVSDGFSLLC